MISTHDAPLRAAADVVVIGSGLGGLELASELLALGQREVLVLESGHATYEPGGAPPRWQSARPPHYVGSRWGVGGRSLGWHGVVLRIENWGLQDAAWPAVIRKALLGDESGTPSLYAEVEADLANWVQVEAGWEPAAGADAAFVDWLTRAMDGAGQAAPVPQAVRRRWSGGREQWRAYMPLDRWYALGGGVGGAVLPTIVPCAEALEVRPARGAGYEVIVQDTSRQERGMVAASRVVLAAGTLENTRLAAQLLGQYGHSVERWVGLNDHLTQGFVLAVPPARLALQLPEMARPLALVTRDGARRCNVFARLHPAGAAGQPRLLDVWAMGEQERSMASHLTFDRRSQAPWTALVHPGLSAADEAVIAAEHEVLADVWTRLARRFGSAALPLAFPDFLGAPRRFEDARGAALGGTHLTPVTYAWPLGAGDHEGGTLVLGELLDEAGSLRAAPGVVVVGPATFPRAGAANPSLTTLALARRTARALLAG